jgi:DNA-binding CsgD family transcriptional regulator
MESTALPLLDESFPLAETFGTERPTPGILLFNFGLQLLYLNRGATELIHRLHEAVNGTTGQGVLPLPVLSLCENLMTLLRSRPSSKNGEEVQLKRVVGDQQGSILLRGFALPHAGSWPDGRLLVLMEAFYGQQEMIGGRVQERYHLTTREQAVLNYLLQGLTNKEIAIRLGISGYTVKDHLKCLMQKTQTTTRTGLVTRILLTIEGKS